MQPPEPPPEPPPGTSLDLPDAPREQAPARATDLELPVPTPASAPPPEPAPSPPSSDGVAGSTPGPLGDLVAAHFARVEIALLGRVLIATLGGALPPSMVRVERRRSLGRRLAGRAGEPIGIAVTAGDRMLSFRAPEVGVAEASVGHVVRGVVLSSTPVPVEHWLEELGSLLDQVAHDDAATRAALERALLS